MITQAIEQIRGIDIYLLDQLMKGNIASEHTILDAGCGNGRNIRAMLADGWQVTAIDPKAEAIDQLRLDYPDKKAHFHCTSIQDFETETLFDVVICSAVLHFAGDHADFNAMMAKLAALLKEDGLLFIRMTSTHTLTGIETDENGIAHLPDESYRYVITPEQIETLTIDHPLRLSEPVKSVNVNDLRSMTTLVFRKSVL